MDNQNAQTQIQIPDEIQGYLESLLQDANISTLDEQTREGMIQELYLRLDHFLTAQIIDNLPDDQIDPFLQMNEEGKTREEIEAFLKEHMPNAQDVFARAFVEFRDLYLGNVAVAQNAPADLNNSGGTH